MKSMSRHMNRVAFPEDEKAEVNAVASSDDGEKAPAPESEK